MPRELGSLAGNISSIPRGMTTVCVSATHLSEANALRGWLSLALGKVRLFLSPTPELNIPAFHHAIYNGQQFTSHWCRPNETIQVILLWNIPSIVFSLFNMLNITGHDQNKCIKHQLWYTSSSSICFLFIVTISYFASFLSYLPVFFPQWFFKRRSMGRLFELSLYWIPVPLGTVRRDNIG